MGRLYLPGVLWAYCNTPHEVTKEKPSFLLFGLDLKSLSEAALLPVSSMESSIVEKYREQLGHGDVVLFTVTGSCQPRTFTSQVREQVQPRCKRMEFCSGSWIGYRSSFSVMSWENTISYPNPGMGHIVSYIWMRLT